MIKLMGFCPEPWPVSQQESPQTGASTPVPRPETTPDLSGWTGTGTEWVEKPSDQESWVEAAWEDPSPNTALGRLPPVVPAGFLVILLGGVLAVLSVLLRP